LLDRSTKAVSICNSRNQLGKRTLSTTWVTPFDWITSPTVIVDIPPFSSVSMILPSCKVAVSTPPETVFNTALPEPILI